MLFSFFFSLSILILLFAAVPFGCPSPNYQTAYLCGHSDVCTIPPDEAAFTLAKKHLGDLLFSTYHSFLIVNFLFRRRDWCCVCVGLYWGMLQPPPFTLSKYIQVSSMFHYLIVCNGSFEIRPTPKTNEIIKMNQAKGKPALHHLPKLMNRIDEVDNFDKM